nr:putative ribonuclease h protein [Quercus suber]
MALGLKLHLLCHQEARLSRFREYLKKKKKDNSPLSQAQGCKRPVVVLRTDKPLPEVVWPEKQAEFPNPTDMKEPNSQQTNSAILEESQVDKTEGGNVYANSVGLVDASEAGKNFEVTLDELDKKIAMFDVPPVSCGEILNPLGPLISGPSKSIPLPNSIGPLANISNLSPSHDNPVPKTSPQWAQIKRQVGISDESEALNITLVNAIPLSLADTPDWLFWPKTSSGTYSVKSGYKLLREVDVVEAPGASDLSGNRDVWKQIWKLHVPNRIRTLLWRACCDSLPSKANQVRRKLLIDGTCPNCSLEPETITHALWSCKKLDSVWLP